MVIFFKSYIVNMQAAFQDKQNLYVLMQYLRGGDLRYHINCKVQYQQTAISFQIQLEFILCCVLQGLEYLHMNNIIHRDVKPQNLIFDEKGFLKITDFGIARYWKPENNHQTSGTPGYMAPEVMCRQNHSFCVDYFAVGIIGYQLVQYKRPYLGKTRKQIRDQIMAKQAKLRMEQVKKNVTKQCLDFINRVFFINQLLERKPKNRLGYNGFSQIKKHPWIKNFDWTSLDKRKMIVPFKPSSTGDNCWKMTDIYSEPTQLQKQNTLLLKRTTVQQLFDGFEYDRQKDKIQQIQTEPIQTQQSIKKRIQFKIGK